MFEPSDSQEAYDYLDAGLRLSEEFGIPVILRMTTRVCHSKTVVRAGELPAGRGTPCSTSATPRRRVMIPAYARPAHRRLREKLQSIEHWDAAAELNRRIDADKALGVIASGIAFQHAREAAPGASFLKLAMTYPLPIEAVRQFAASVRRCVVVEEGEAVLADAIRAAGVAVESKAEAFRFGELNVARVQAILAGAKEEEVVASPPTRPPQLCPGCPHRIAFRDAAQPALHRRRRHRLLHAGHAAALQRHGHVRLHGRQHRRGAGAAAGAAGRAGPARGQRHRRQHVRAQRHHRAGGHGVQRPGDGHVVIILDNGTTAMTGLQEHPGTGRSLKHEPSGGIVLETLCAGLGVANVHVLDPVAQRQQFVELLRGYIERPTPAVIIARRTCLLASGKIKEYQKARDKNCNQAAQAKTQE